MRDARPPLDPSERYRMRRLTDDEMARLVALARDGRKGPGRAIDALWELILHEAEGVSVAEAAARPGGYRVQDYAMARDQADALLDAITKRRRLTPRTVGGFHQLWAMYSPCDYEPEEDDD